MSPRRQDAPGPASGTSRVPGLREFAMLADGERAAVLGPHGDIVWMCVPSWADDAVLSALIGGGGHYIVQPTERFTWGGAYDDGTLIWRSSFVTRGGVLHVESALAMPADPDRAVLLHRLRVDRGPVELDLRLDVRGGFGRRSMREVTARGTAWTARTGDLRVRWTGAPGAHRESRGGGSGDDGGLSERLVLSPGQHLDLVLEVSDGPLPAAPDPHQAWAATRAAWAGRPDPPDLGLAERDARLAGAVLRGLTSSRGGMVAAATMSLPERVEHDRNYDYRYAWIRDQCYAGLAGAATGLHDVLDSAVGFVTARVLDDGDRLRPAYTVDGGPVPSERSLRLPGYPGGADIVGNRARHQFQLDVLGDVLRLLTAAARADRLDQDGWQALQVAAAAVRDRWTEPDSGIWELGEDWWTQSRLSVVAGLRDAAQITPAGPPAARPARRPTARRRRPMTAGDLAGLADAILAETTSRCLHPTGRWQRSPTRPEVDASLLWSAACGALPPQDPRTTATLAAVLADVVEDGYVYRYIEPGRRPGEVEGAFLLCGFMLARSLAQQGRLADAGRWFERTRASCGSPGLFTEEYDVRQRQLRGNLPQAFVHAAMLEVAAALPQSRTDLGRGSGVGAGA